MSIDVDMSSKFGHYVADVILIPLRRRKVVMNDSQYLILKRSRSGIEIKSEYSTRFRRHCDVTLT